MSGLRPSYVIRAENQSAAIASLQAELAEARGEIERLTAPAFDVMAAEKGIVLANFLMEMGRMDNPVAQDMAAAFDHWMSRALVAEAALADEASPVGGEMEPGPTMEDAWNVARAALAFRLKCRLDAERPLPLVTIGDGMVRELIAALESQPSRAGQGGAE